MRYFLILLLTGCVPLRPARSPITTLRTASSPERCAALASRAVTEHILALVFSGLGTSAASISPTITNTTAQDIVLGTASALGVVGTVLSYTAGVASADYSKECP